MFEDWIEILLHGAYEVDVPALTIAGDNIGQLRGSGRLSWQGSRIRVQAHTDGAASVFPAFGALMGSPGQLIPRAAYATATGRTQVGWDASTNPEVMNGFHTVADSPHVVWDFTTRGLTLTQDDSSDDGRVLRAVLGPPPRDWPRNTETAVINDYFGDRRGSLDWLLARPSFGVVAARQRSEQWFELRIEFERDPPCPGAFEILTGVGRAFGFVVGRRSLLRGFVDRCAHRETRHLADPIREPTKNTLYTPLGTNLAYSRHVETLLGQAIDFFLTEQGERVAQHLYLCWDTADNAWPTRLTVASICAEGLVRLASRGGTGDDGSHTHADVAAAHQWLATNKATLSARFIDRLRGFLGTLNHRRPVDVLRHWQRQGLLGVTAEDVAAWQDLRNPGAHGGLVAPAAGREKLQANAMRLARVINLINRVVLQLMGYRGQYVDYSQPGWPEVEFPAAPAEGL